MYESVARVDKIKTGWVVFLDQAINISGGINPNNVSDVKKVIKIPVLEKVSVIVSRPLLISYTYLLKKYKATTTRIIGKKAFFTLSQTNR